MSTAQELEQLFDTLPGLLRQQRPLIPQVATRFLRIQGAYRRQQEFGLHIRGTARGLKELQAIEKLLSKVSEKINSMSVDAAQAYHGTSLAALAEELADVIPAVKAAHARLSKEKEPVRPPKGQRKPYAAAVTEEAKTTYAQLTGKKLGRSINPNSGKPSGRSHEFVEEIFRILNVNAKAGSQIALMVEREKS